MLRAASSLGYHAKRTQPGAMRGVTATVMSTLRRAGLSYGKKTGVRIYNETSSDNKINILYYYKIKF